MISLDDFDTVKKEVNALAKKNEELNQRNRQLENLLYSIQLEIHYFPYDPQSIQKWNFSHLEDIFVKTGYQLKGKYLSLRNSQNNHSHYSGPSGQ